MVHGKLQIFFFMDKNLVAKYIPEGEGLANEGWDLRMKENEGICSDWRASYFEMMVKRSWPKRPALRSGSEDQAHAWNLISANINRQSV